MEEDIEELKKPRWEAFNVLEQLSKIGEDHKNPKNPTKYNDLTIPWGGLGGITLFCKKDNKEGMDILNSYKSEKIYLPFYDKYEDAVRLSL